MDNKIAHLGFIEDAINRLSEFGARIKEWNMIIMAAMLGITFLDNSQTNNWIPFLCGACITLVCCFLDAYYLYKERLYRELYNVVVKLNESEIDFSMNSTKGIDKSKKIKLYGKAIVSKTISPYYLVSILVYVLFFLLPILIKVEVEQ